MAFDNGRSTVDQRNASIILPPISDADLLALVNEPNPMMAELPLPDPEALTGPFPLASQPPQHMTREQVETAVICAPRLYSNGTGVPSKAIARVSDYAVVKFGTDVCLGEGRSMMAVQQQVHIAMPHVYDCWMSPLSDEQAKYGHATHFVYILMQYISGQVLEKVIEEVTEDQKRDLSCQLIRLLDELHTVRHNIPGAVGSGLALAPALFTTGGAGPFQSVSDLISWFNACLNLCQSFGKASRQQPFDDDIKADSLVMCHMDLHLQNLILDNAGKLWLIDWDCAGFYPEYFEYVCLKKCYRFRNMTGSQWLDGIANAMETSEGQRMNVKFDAIGYALLK